MTRLQMASIGVLIWLCLSTLTAGAWAEWGIASGFGIAMSCMVLVWIHESGPMPIWVL